MSRNDASFPKTVLVAGAICIVLSCVPLFIVIGGVTYLIISNPTPTKPWTTVLLTDGWILVPSFVAFIVTCGLIPLAIRYTGGRAKDTLAIGIVSIIVGLILGGFAGPTVAGVIRHWIVLGSADLSPSRSFMGFLMGGALLLAVMLLTAGVMFLIGRKSYLAWKHEKRN
jgi:hypothetical protein